MLFIKKLLITIVFLFIIIHYLEESMNVGSFNSFNFGNVDIECEENAKADANSKISSEAILQPSQVPIQAASIQNPNQEPVHLPILKSARELDCCSRIAYIALSILTLGLLPLIQLVVIPYFFEKNKLLYEIKIAELDNLSKTSADPRIHDTVKKIKSLIIDKYFNFKTAADNHMLHDLVTDITLKVRQDDKLKVIWQTFLYSTDKKLAFYQDHRDITLDFTTEITYLNDPKKNPGPVIVEELLKSNKKEHEIALRELADIDLEAFGERESWSLDSIRVAANKPGSIIIVARDELSKKIEGFAISRKEQTINEGQQLQKIHVLNVARKANASKRGIASRIFKDLTTKYNPDKLLIYLEVRKGNTQARKLYESFGFSPFMTTPNLYSYPSEDGLSMMRQ